MRIDIYRNSVKVADKESITKEQARYVNWSPDPNRQCQFCTMFDPHMQRCSMFPAYVMPTGTCDYFEKK